MVNRSQIVHKTKLQWSLLLAVLLGICSFSAPHLLGHAHAHHTGTGRNSGSSHRSRSGSYSADGDHDSDAVAKLKAFDPYTPDHAAAVVALIPAATFTPVQWVMVEVVAPQDEAVASLLAGSPHRGRAPPVA